MVILLTSGTCRPETSSNLAALSKREMGSDSPVDCHVSERRAGESGAAPPVAEAASRFQGSVPMAAPRIGTGIGRHDEGRGEANSHRCEESDSRIMSNGW